MSGAQTFGLAWEMLAIEVKCHDQGGEILGKTPASVSEGENNVY